MKTLLEWLEDNRSELKNGIYSACGMGNICRDNKITNNIKCKPTLDKYQVTDGVIALLTQPVSDLVNNKHKTASDYLKDGADLLSERGKQYDKSGQERSMEKIVRIFNDMTGQNLTTVQGWYFMQVLKDVRFFQNPETVHKDSLLDKISYVALLAEEALKNDE